MSLRGGSTCRIAFSRFVFAVVLPCRALPWLPGCARRIGIFIKLLCDLCNKLLRRLFSEDREQLFKEMAFLQMEFFSGRR